MDEYTTDYVSFVMEQFYEMKDGGEDPLVLIEQRLDFSSYVPDGFGTGDAVLVSPGKLHVIDFKYGQGVLVDAERNSQNIKESARTRDGSAESTIFSHGDSGFSLPSFLFCADFVGSGGFQI